MEIEFRACDLRLCQDWTIANSRINSPRAARVVFVELRCEDGLTGLGEAAPSARYAEDSQTVLKFLSCIDPSQLTFGNVPASMAYLETVAPGNCAAKAAINVALLDGAARRAGSAVYDFLKLGFRENHHITSFSIGLGTPEAIRARTLEAAPYPILKLKLGALNDHENLKALREAAPEKTLRVDANEAWKSRELALRQIEWLAADRNVQFVEQPMPADAPIQDLIWLKERSPLPIIGDESYHHADDIDHCAACYHGVNVKLEKSGGITGALAALHAARKAGLKTMLGCMIESSILITAAAHLAELADFLDIDGNLLVTNDPFQGVTAAKGMISFANAKEKSGLRVSRRKT